MSVDVRILDRSYKLSCESSEEEQLLKAVSLLEQKIQETRRAMPRLESERLAVLVALSLAQEVLSLNKSLQEQTHCQRLIKQMINETEKTLAQHS